MRCLKPFMSKRVAVSLAPRLYSKCEKFSDEPEGILPSKKNVTNDIV